MRFVKVRNGDISLNVAVEGQGPLILCVHGFPELWYSWRHQIRHFAARGYTVAALDVRGYGGSDRPAAIEAYTMRTIASDVAAVIDALGDGQAILFGHDWGAPIVWNSALLHPDKVKAVAGLSIPYVPRGSVNFLDAVRGFYKDRFFYQLYFQEEGRAEAELEADIPATLRKMYFAMSGDAPPGLWLKPKPQDARFLDGLIDPSPFPAWMSDEDLSVYVDAFSRSGFRGPINRYRAQTIDDSDLTELIRKPLTQPAFFIGGEHDPVRAFIPGADLYAQPGKACNDFRGSVILDRIGHWVQQEAPDAVNNALEGFLAGL